MLFGTLYLGDNEITDCQQALVVEGTEVFRLRDRTHDDQLVVDFDVRNQAGARLAKIAKNHVVYIAEHVESRSRPKLYEIVSRGDVLASVEGGVVGAQLDSRDQGKLWMMRRFGEGLGQPLRGVVVGDGGHRDPSGHRQPDQLGGRETAVGEGGVEVEVYAGHGTHGESTRSTRSMLRAFPVRSSTSTITELNWRGPPSATFSLRGMAVRNRPRASSTR